MIEWKEYDPSNPPKLGKMYLVHTRTKIMTAWIDKNHYSDRVVWFNDDWENVVDHVTHYADINVPVLYATLPNERS